MACCSLPCYSIWYVLLQLYSFQMLRGKQAAKLKLHATQRKLLMQNNVYKAVKTKQKAGKQNLHVGTHPSMQACAPMHVHVCGREREEQGVRDKAHAAWLRSSQGYVPASVARMWYNSKFKWVWVSGRANHEKHVCGFVLCELRWKSGEKKKRWQ